MLALLAQAASDFDYNYSVDVNSTGDTAVATGLFAGGIMFIIWLVFMVAVAAFYVWSFGNILQAALGKSKWQALLLFIPIVNFVFMVIWGLEASKKNKESIKAAPSQGSGTDTAVK